VSDYLKKWMHLNQQMRIKTVNWMVDLQESFELNHETLYLGVKLFDLFLDRSPTLVLANELQLIASAALFVASKFDVSF
jgi:cyclin B